MKICAVKGCSNKYYSKGFCNRHYLQMWKFGFIQNRTKADPNEFTIEGDICLIGLYNNKSEKIAEAIIDSEDYERCKIYRWYALKDNGVGNLYVRSEKVGWLAPFILGIKTDNKIVVDHKDGNALDNRKTNLQKITHQQNCFKQKLSSLNESGYRGVTGKEGKWRAQIGFNGGRYNLGVYSEKNLAALAYNEKAKELFGRFAVLNIIKEETSSIRGMSCL
jgi:hypothetical protein